MRTLSELGNALQGYHQAVLAPVWPRIRALIDADRAMRARALLDHGTDGLLHSLRPALRWTPPVLKADYPGDRDLHLAGRGLLLVPSVFCHRNPVTLIDPDLAPVLIYPVAPQRDWRAHPAPARSDAPARLLGPGRAAALRGIEHGRTTSELARRTVLAPSTASQHATALRAANLIRRLLSARRAPRVPMSAPVVSSRPSHKADEISEYDHRELSLNLSPARWSCHDHRPTAVSADRHQQGTPGAGL